MKTATINLRALSAIANAASTEETRYYLNGVLVTATASHVEYVATDGHVLAATRREQQGECDAPFIGSLIIPVAICKHFKLKRSSFEYATLTHIEGLKFSLSHEGISITFDAIDGTFPDWRRVIPSELNCEVAQFAHNVLEKLAKVAKELSGGGREDNKLTIAHNGNGPALVGFLNANDPESFGVIMPYRFEAHVAIPSWVNDRHDSDMLEAAE